MGGWRQCAGFLLLAIVVSAAVGSLAVALYAVVRGWRAAERLRQPIPQPQKASEEKLTDEQKEWRAKHWDGWRKRMAGYASEYNQLVNPLRKDTIDIIKESANWARLAVQYALIGNGGAMAALPYLLSKTSRPELPIGDAVWSALWFAVGLLSAASCCLVAYLDFMVTVTIYNADQKVTTEALSQRHFETSEEIEIAPQVTMRNVLAAVTIRTGLAGVVLGIIAWLALAWGACRLILSLSP